MKRNGWIGFLFAGIVLSWVIPHSSKAVFGQAAPAGAPHIGEGGLPQFEKDPNFPKVPSKWRMGFGSDVAVDAQDHVWTIHRPNTVEDNFKAVDMKVGACCKVAPPILEYDQAGTLINSWGGPGAGYDWPDSNHGITIDHKGNVWIAGNGTKDTQVLKFTSSGKFLMQLGKHGVHNGSNDPENFWQATKIFDDPTAN